MLINWVRLTRSNIVVLNIKVNGWERIFIGQALLLQLEKPLIIGTIKSRCTLMVELPKQELAILLRLYGKVLNMLVLAIAKELW